jgi:hypothetical protein
MKALKITLMLAVFCLTVSGSSSDLSNEVVNDTLKEINKSEMQYAGPITKNKTKLPGQV